MIQLSQKYFHIETSYMECIIIYWGVEPSQSPTVKWAYNIYINQVQFTLINYKLLWDKKIDN